MDTTFLTTLWGALAGASAVAGQVLPSKYAPWANIAAAFFTGMLGYHAAGRATPPKR